MRAGIYGSEIIIDDGNFIGVNLGYNYYAEHECDLKCLVEKYNRKDSSQSAKDKEIKKKYKDSWVKDYILNPDTTGLIKRTIVFDNSKPDYYDNYLSRHGEYLAMYIGKKDTYEYSYWNKTLVSNKVYREDELIQMSDYARKIEDKSQSRLITGNLHICHEPDLIGLWTGTDTDILLMIRKDRDDWKILVDGITNALHDCNLAVVNGIQNVFKDRGLILIDVSKFN